MAKEYSWNVNVDGVAHRVDCIPTNNKYQIFVDEDFLTNVYRKSVRSMARDGLEEKISVCGKECLFLVWDETPDLVVDGVLLGRGIDYAPEKEKRDKGAKTVYGIIFWIGVALLVLMGVCALLGWSKAIGWDDVTIYTIAAIWMMLYGGRKMWRLTHS